MATDCQFRRRWLPVAFALAVMVCCAPAQAVHHLIRAGDDWQHLGARLRPGDEIILMPGKHRGASFDRIVGTPQRPITIRSADPEHPSTIMAEREGIRVRHASHLIIKNLVISGATINGITLGGGGHQSIAEQSANVQLLNLTIQRTGPRGLRHGISAQWITQLRIDDCKIEGWGGSAIEAIGCQDVSITRCLLLGLQDHGQMHGIRARAGSSNVVVEECTMENVGPVAIALGGESDPGDHPAKPATAESDAARCMFEIMHAQVQRSLVLGSQCPVALTNAEGCSIRNNTFIRPGRCAVAFALSSKASSASSAPPPRHDIGRNLILWQPGDLTRLVEISPSLDPARISWDANLWWSSDLHEQREKLGTLPGRELLPQVMDVDPQVDGSYRPQAQAAAGFGF